VISFRQISDGFPERYVPVLHHEVEDVPAAAAPEAIVKLVLGIDMERWGLLLMKRAQSQVPVARAPQLDDLSDDVDNVNGLLHKNGHSGTIHV